MADEYLEGIMNRQSPAMTAQDVAGVIAEKLRGLARDCVKMEDLHDAAFFNDAATILESQAQALSEVTGQADTYCKWWREQRARALAAESFRAEAMRVIGFYADPRRYEGPNQRPIPDDPFAKPDAGYITDVTRDHGGIARDFLNAANARANQEKTDAR